MELPDTDQTCEQSNSYNSTVKRLKQDSSDNSTDLEKAFREAIEKYPQSYWVGFTSYLLIWMNTHPTEKYVDLSKRVKIHELRVPKLKNSIQIEEGQSDIQRFIFIEEDGIMSFGIFFDELASQQTSYVAYLEYSCYGTNPFKAVLQAYSEFIALIRPGWTLQIWADPPPKGKAYIFRNHPGTKEIAMDKKTRAKELKEKYASILQLSGFIGKHFEWEPTFPTFPDYGQKAEDNVRKKYEKLKERILKEVQDFNQKNFTNTHCVRLELFCDESAPVRGKFFRTAGNVEELEQEYFGKKRTYDFCTEDKARKSTEMIITFLKSYGSRYWKHDLIMLNPKVKNYYSAILDWVRFVQRKEIKE